eukprot:TRINITY_DN35348_c0_g1_i1.p1 TRINITY_DN35348_c0_g1~~TRINITY_DN35348_c0_g1_i1.p1  ORF type:complete len:498 (-),score=113.24 TRINITY_DN35348_c0_g1_i1:215-1708(-)
MPNYSEEELQAMRRENAFLKQEMARLAADPVPAGGDARTPSSSSRMPPPGVHRSEKEVTMHPILVLEEKPRGKPDQGLLPAISAPDSGKKQQSGMSASVSLPALGSGSAMAGAEGMIQRQRNRSSLDESSSGLSKSVSLPALASATPASQGRKGPSQLSNPDVERKHQLAPRHQQTKKRRRGVVEKDLHTFVRDVLIAKAGGLKQAYGAMDVCKTGEVDAESFAAALRRLDFKRRSPIDGLPFRNAKELFMALDEESSGSLSLSKLLGYTPNVRQAAMKDTRALWIDYSKASSQGATLERKPMWKDFSVDLAAVEADPSPIPAMAALAAPHVPEDCWEHMSQGRQRRRDLHKLFVEDRQGMAAEQKREFVPGLVAPEVANRRKESEKRQLNSHRQRIVDAIKGCSQARHELKDMQRLIAGVSKPVEEEKDPNAYLRDQFKLFYKAEKVEEKTLQPPESPQKVATYGRRSVKFASEGDSEEIGDERGMLPPKVVHLRY